MADIRDPTGHSRGDVDTIVQAWLCAGQEQILHLTGAPGAGKTTWAQLFAENTALHETCGATLARAHFCSRADVTTTNAYGFVEDLAFGLARVSPAFATALLTARNADKSTQVLVTQKASQSSVEAMIGVQIGELKIGGMSAREMFARMVLKPLHTLEAEQVFLILVDALDEAETGVAYETSIDELLFAAGSLPPTCELSLPLAIVVLCAGGQGPWRGASRYL